jgi:hypothetical protein
MENLIGKKKYFGEPGVDEMVILQVSSPSSSSSAFHVSRLVARYSVMPAFVGLPKDLRPFGFKGEFGIGFLSESNIIKSNFQDTD